MMDSSNVRRHAERLCAAVAPRDLEGTPVYIVTYSRIPYDCRACLCDGYTQPSLDL